MIPFLISFLFLLLYVVVCVLLIEACLWVIAKIFEPVPDRMRKGLYGIVAILFIIGVIEILAGGWHPALYGPGFR